MKKLVSFGEILMRLTSENHMRLSQTRRFEVFYGGSEANVLFSAAGFGKAAKFVTVLPNNDLGRVALNYFKISDINSEHILFRGDRLGLYFLEKGAVNRSGKVIYDRNNSAFSQAKREWFDWEKILQDCDWFHWSGITPAVSQNAADICRDALEVAESLGIMISADLNYRANLWNYDSNPEAVMAELVSKSNVLLAGHYACQQFFRLECTIESNRMLSEKLMEKFPKLKKIAITTREEISASHNKWSASLFSESAEWHSPVYDILPIIDRVGTGDSFMGALIFGLQNYEDQKALEFATAASALKHTVEGDINVVTKDEVLKLTQGDTSGRLRR